MKGDGYRFAKKTASLSILSLLCILLYTNMAMAAGVIDSDKQQEAIRTLVWLTGGFLIGILLLIFVLFFSMKSTFWNSINAGQMDLNKKAIAETLLQLPFGIPEGTVRAIISIFVIFFWIACSSFK